MSPARPTKAPRRPASGLAALQSAVAALVMEPGRVEAFRRGPAAYARRAGLRGEAARLLAGIQPDGVAYFASRRAIDRFHYLQGDLPRSVAAVERAIGLAAGYFADRPYAKEDPRAEARQLRSWARAAQRQGRLHPAVRDLVEVEVAGFLLLGRPRAEHRPAPGRRLRRAPGVRLLRLRHDPDGLLRDPLGAQPGRFAVALQREPHDVEVHRLGPADAALLHAATGRRGEAAVLQALLPRLGGKAVAASLRRLRRKGLLVAEATPVRRQSSTR